MKQTAATGSRPTTHRPERRTTPPIVAAIAAIALCGGFAAPVSAGPVDPPLLINGGFEDGDFTGWTLDDPSFFTGVFCPGPGPDVAEGFCSAFSGAQDVGATLAQTFATTPGQTYVLSFQFKPDGGSPALLTASTDGHLLFSSADAPASGFEIVRRLFLATAPTTTLTFGLRDDPGFVLLDAVAVTVPEPASAALLGLGLAALALTRRRTS